MMALQRAALLLLGLCVGPLAAGALDRPIGVCVLRPPAPMRLRGGTDIKWTPGDDKPNAPFSKRARDEQARAEGRDPDAPPPEGWSLVSVAAGVANAISEHPREAATLVAAAAAGYSVMSIRRKIRQDWPITLRTQGPHMTWLRPQGRYLKDTLLPHVRVLQLASPREMPLTLAPKTGGKGAADVPGYSVLTRRVKVGAGAQDAMEVCNAVRAWRAADAVDGLSAIVSRKAVAGAGAVGDSVVLVHRTRLGYLSSPWRVTHYDSPAQFEEALNSSKAACGGQEGAAGVGEGGAAASARSWRMVCSALAGSAFEGELSFRVEMAEDEGVWFEVTAATKRAAGSSLLLVPLLSSTLRSALEEMAGKLQGMVETQKDMRLARERRLQQAQVSNDAARAQVMADKVLKQQDKLNLESNRWKRGNIG